jgi:hypothetical protein
MYGAATTGAMRKGVEKAWYLNLCPVCGPEQRAEKKKLIASGKVEEAQKLKLPSLLTGEEKLAQTKRKFLLSNQSKCQICRIMNKEIVTAYKVQANKQPGDESWWDLLALCPECVVFITPRLELNRGRTEPVRQGTLDPDEALPRRKTPQKHLQLGKPRRTRVKNTKTPTTPV